MSEIKGNQIIQDEHLANAIKNAERYLEITKQTTAALVEEAKALRAVVAVNPMSGAKDYNQLAGALKSSQVALKQFNTEQAEARKLQKQLNDATDENVKGQIRLQNARREQKKALAEIVALENKELGTLQKLAIASNKLRAERDKLNLETKEGTQRLKEINKQLDINNAKIKASSDIQKQGKLTVGQYTDSINKAKIGIMNLASAFGIASGIMLFTNALKGAFNIIKENEDAFASLSAITGLTGDKFEVFKTAINKTANELKVSSTDVAEAAEKIASAQPKLLENADALAEVTKQAIILNKAIKGDLTETSMALVGVMNQFGFSGEEAARVINVLAAGSKAGAATVNQLNESMTKSGAVASIQGIKLEELTGAIETLGEKAIFGADAGTALRNIFLKMGGIDALPKNAMKQLQKYGVDTDIVKDKSLSLEERLRELSKVAGDSTAIMKIFGTENATAATILLNNIDTYSNMTEAVTGTNVAVEQMTINNDTLSNKLEELSAKWSNMITEWSDGKGVGEGLKDVIGFITDNLEGIVKAVILGVKAWILYKSTLTLVNNAGTGAIQMFQNLRKGADGAKFSLGTLTKGLAGVLGIAVILIPLLWDAGKAIYQMIDRTTALEKVTDKLNERMDDEHAKMELLRVKIFQTNAGSKERQVLIDEINATYGTTLQNLSDETAFMDQLWEAYKRVNSEMEKRINQQLIEEELTNLFREKRRLENQLADLGTGYYDIQPKAIFEEKLGTTIADIKELQKELFLLDEMSGATAEGFGNLHKGTAKVGDEMDAATTAINGTKNALSDLQKEMANLDPKKLKTPSPFAPINNKEKLGEEPSMWIEVGEKIIAERKRMYQILIDEQEKSSQIMYMNLLASNASMADIEKAMRDKEIQDLKDRSAYALEIFGEYSKEYIDANLALQLAIRKEDDELTQDRIDNINKIIDATKDLAKALEDSNNLKIQKIDQEIANHKDEIAMRNDRISQMKELAAQGVLTAQESIKAEEMKVDSLQNRIAELEAKKQKLLVINLALQTAMNLAEGGDGSAIAKATGQIGEMFAKIKSYKSGVDRTGRGDVDSDGGFHAVLHPNEMVVQAPLTKGLYERGLDRDDTAMYAMRYHDEVMNGNAMSYGSFSDVMTLATLNGIKDGQDKVVELLTELPKRMPVNKLDYDPIQKALIETIKTNNEIKRYFTYPKK